MLWYALAQLFSTFLELMRVVQLSSDEKDLEILILRQQLDVLVRKNAQVIRPSRLERWSLAVLAVALKKRSRLTTTQLGNVIRIVKPETVIKWNRQRPLQSSQQAGGFFRLSSGRSIKRELGALSGWFQYPGWRPM